MRDALMPVALLALPFVILGGMYLLLVPKTQSYHQKFVQHCEQRLGGTAAYDGRQFVCLR